MVLALLLFSCEKRPSFQDPKNDPLIHSYHKSDSSSLPPDSFLTSVSVDEIRLGNLSDIVTAARAYTPSITSHTITFSDSTDTTVTLSSKMLSFTDTSDYFDALAIADYTPYDSIVQLTSNFSGFNSSYIDFIGESIVGSTINDDVVEDFLKATNRKLLNEDNAVKIGNYVYIDFPDKEESYAYDLNGSNHFLIDYSGKTYSDCPNVGVFTYSIGWYNSSGRKSSAFDTYALLAYKANHRGTFDAKVEMGFMLYEYNSGTGDYILRTTSTFGIWHDHWPDHLLYKKKGASTYTTRIEKWLYETNMRTLNPRYIFKRIYGFAPVLCVDEFGRTHNWIWNFYEDVHNDVVW